MMTMLALPPLLVTDGREMLIAEFLRRPWVVRSRYMYLWK